MKKIFIISLAIIYIMGCKNVTGSSDIGVIMPLEIGNSWIYDDGDEIIINSKTHINGYTWFVDNSNEHYRNDSDGLWLYDFEGGGGELLIKYPIDVNESFMGFLGQTTCKSKNTTFYEYKGCYEYSQSNSEDGVTAEFIWYFKPNIGMVGYKFIASYSGDTFEDENVLNSYNLN